DPWPAPVALAELNTASYDDNGWLAGDGLVVDFSSTRPGGAGDYDLYRAERASVDVAFDPPVQVAELATVDGETDPHLTADQRTSYFSVLAAGSSDLFVATA